MSQPWSQVIQSPQYQALPDDQKEAARQQYFQQVIAPQAGSQADQARAQFDAQYGPQSVAAKTLTVTPANGTTDDTDASPGFFDGAGRQLSMSAHSLAKSIPGLVDVVTALPRAGINAAEEKLGVDPKYRLGSLGDTASAGLTALGVPDYQPQTKAEQYVQAANRGVGGVIGGVGTGAGLSTAANPTLASVGSSLASNVGAQTTSGITGALSGEAAKQAGAGPVGQTLATLAGGLAPIAPQIASSGVQAALVGGQAGRQKVAQAIQDFSNSGTSPTVGQAVGTPFARGAESLLSKTPGAVNVMKGAAETQAGQVSGKLSDIANDLAPNADSGAAGRAITKGVTGAGGFVDRFKDQSSELYNKLDDYLPPDTRVSIENTQKILPELNAIIQGAPNTSKLFQNAKIMGIENGLKADAMSPEAAMSRPEVQQAMAQMKAKIDSTNQQIQAQNAAGQAAADQANAMRAGQSPIQFTPKPLISQQETNDQLRNVAASFVDNKLPYEAVKKLRTLVGDQLSDFSLTSDVPRSKWKAVYAALSNDMKSAADAQGPEAAQAWNRANNYYNAGQGRIDAISGVLDKNGGPESVFNAAMAGTKDGDSTLHSVMQSLQPDQQKVLTAAVVNRLGKANPGMQNAAGDEFNMGTFLTNWNKLSPKARSELFDRYGDNFSTNMNSLAKVAENVRTGSKYLSNPSGSAATGAQLGTVGGMIMSALTGHPGTAAAIATGMGGANGLARLMTNPTFVNFLAAQKNVPAQGLVPALSSLQQTADKKKDPDLKAAADALLQQAQGAQ